MVVKLHVAAAGVYGMPTSGWSSYWLMPASVIAAGGVAAGGNDASAVVQQHSSGSSSDKSNVSGKHQ